MAAITFYFDGATYEVDSADFPNGGYLTEETAFGVTAPLWQSALWATVKHAEGAFRGTSETSLAIGTGSKAFTTQPNRPWFVGSWVRIENDADATEWMEGEITAYNAGTGALTVEAVTSNGTGTVDDWVIRSLGKRAAEKIGSVLVVTNSNMNSGTRGSFPPATIYRSQTSSNITFTIDETYLEIGEWVEIVRIGAGTVGIAAGGSAVIRSAVSLVGLAQHSVVRLTKLDATQYVAAHSAV